MNSITPARFYELLEKSDNETIRLWNAYSNRYYCYDYIEKCLYTDAPWEWRVMVNDECGATHNLSNLYESKPQTLYDKLKSCMDNEHYHKLIDGHREYLEAKIIEEPNETNN